MTAYRRSAALFALCLGLTACAQLPVVQTEEERLRTELAEQERQAARTASLCRPEPGNPFSLRKKVLMLSMPVDSPMQAADLPGIATHWPRALQQRLHATDRFLLRDGTAFALDPQRNAQEQVTALARQFDAQFVIAGAFNTLGTHPGAISLGPLKPIPLPIKNERVLETTLTVYDGFSGAPITRLQHRGAVEGQVEYRGNSPMRGVFFDTPFGQAVDKLLTEQSESLEDELACLPMQARVIQVRDGKVRIDAGFTSNIQPGTRLRLLLNDGNLLAPGGQALSTEKPLGDVVIERVFPEHAVGKLDSSLSPEWRGSAYVRSW